MAQRDVLCIGIACSDVLIKGVDLSTPFEQESKPAESINLAVGGDAANESIVLSNLGHDTQLMCGIGKDDIGKYITGFITQNGVDMTLSQESDESESAINVIVIHPDGQRNFINSGVPKAACFKPDISKIKDVKIVSMGSFFLPPFHDTEVCIDTARKAKESGAILCADVVVMEDSTLDKIAPALKYVDYIFPNEDEAKSITGKTELTEIADEFLKRGVKNVIIKTGKKGCFVKNSEMEEYVLAYKNIKAVDTTGAGDNFAAGFISGLLQGMDILQCCKFACGVAAVSIQSYGASTGVKSMEQVRKAIESYSN